MINFTWSDLINIIEKMFDLRAEDIAKYLDVSSSTISRLKNNQTKKPTDFNTKNIYTIFFDLTNKESLATDTEEVLLSTLKEIIEVAGFRNIMVDLWKDEKEEYKDEDYKNFVTKMLERIKSNRIVDYDKIENKNAALSLRQSYIKKTTFFGRKDELKDIDENLKKYDCVLLTGIGGIGKSYTALEYAYNQQENGCVVQFKICDEHDSLRNAVKRLEFEGVSDNNLEFEQIIDILKNIQKPSLIIFDNLNQRFSSTDCEDFKNLTRCNPHIKFIITSREEKLLSDKKEHTVPIKPLCIDTLREFYSYERFWSHENHKSYIAEHDEIILKIFEGVYKHTLMIKLLANIIRDYEDMDEYEIYDKLGLDVSSEIISISKDDKNMEDNIRGIITKLFDISRLSGNQKNIMKHIALLSQNGMRLRLFKELCDYKVDLEKEIFRLRDSGWVIMNEENKRISLHPLISEVIWDMDETKPSDADCHSFIIKMLDKLNNSGSNNNLNFDFTINIALLMQKVDAIDYDYLNKSINCNFKNYVIDEIINTSNFLSDEERTNLMVELEFDIEPLIEYFNFLNLEQEENFKFDKFYNYIYLINYINKTSKSKFQDLIYLFNEIRVCTDIKFDELIETFSNNSHFGKPHDTTYNILFEFINFLCQCNNSIFQYYMDLCNYLYNLE